jgi:hypothetical protein
MRPPVWNPPIELSKQEKKVAKGIGKAKLFRFLRQVRHELFDEQFQTELATLFTRQDSGEMFSISDAVSSSHHFASLHGASASTRCGGSRRWLPKAP